MSVDLVRFESMVRDAIALDGARDVYGYALQAIRELRELREAGSGKPAQTMTVQVVADLSQFNEALARVKAELVEVGALGDRVWARVVERVEVGEVPRTPREFLEHPGPWVAASTVRERGDLAEDPFQYAWAEHLRDPAHVLIWPIRDASGCLTGRWEIIGGRTGMLGGGPETGAVARDVLREVAVNLGVPLAPLPAEPVHHRFRGEPAALGEHRPPIGRVQIEAVNGAQMHAAEFRANLAARVGVPVEIHREARQASFEFIIEEPSGTVFWVGWPQELNERNAAAVAAWVLARRPATLDPSEFARLLSERLGLAVTFLDPVPGRSAFGFSVAYPSGNALAFRLDPSEMTVEQIERIARENPR